MTGEHGEGGNPPPPANEPRMRQLTWWFDSIEELIDWMTDREVYIIETRQHVQAGSGAITYDVTFLVEYERHAEILDLRCPQGTLYPVDEADWDD